MFITRHSIVIDTTHNNSATGIYFYTDKSPNGFIHAVEYIQSTANYVPSTAVLSLYVGSTVHSILKRSATTSFYSQPRGITHDTTGGVMGATTDFPGVPIPVDGSQRLTLSLAGGTSAATTGLVYVWVQGV